LKASRVRGDGSGDDLRGLSDDFDQFSALPDQISAPFARKTDAWEEKSAGFGQNSGSHKEKTSTAARFSGLLEGFSGLSRLKSGPWVEKKGASTEFSRRFRRISCSCWPIFRLRLNFIQRPAPNFCAADFRQMFLLRVTSRSGICLCYRRKGIADTSRVPPREYHDEDVISIEKHDSQPLRPEWEFLRFYERAAAASFV
jgi:hypothetical protein